MKATSVFNLLLFPFSGTLRHTLSATHTVTVPTAHRNLTCSAHNQTDNPKSVIGSLGSIFHAGHDIFRPLSFIAFPIPYSIHHKTLLFLIS